MPRDVDTSIALLQTVGGTPLSLNTTRSGQCRRGSIWTSCKEMQQCWKGTTTSQPFGVRGVRQNRLSGLSTRFAWFNALSPSPTLSSGRARLMWRQSVSRLRSTSRGVVSSTIKFVVWLGEDMLRILWWPSPENRCCRALVAAASPNPGPSCESLLNAKDSSALGTSLAPPNGLYLADVEYDQLDDMCRSVSDHDSCQAVTKLCHETALQLPCPEDGPFISSYTATSPLASVRFHTTDTGWRCTLTTGDEGEYVREDTFPPPMEDHSYPFPIVSALIRGVWAEHLSQKPIHFPFPFN